MVAESAAPELVPAAGKAFVRAFALALALAPDNARASWCLEGIDLAQGIGMAFVEQDTDRHFASASVPALALALALEPAPALALALAMGPAPALALALALEPAPALALAAPEWVLAVSNLVPVGPIEP